MGANCVPQRRGTLLAGFDFRSKSVVLLAEIIFGERAPAKSVLASFAGRGAAG